MTQHLREDEYSSILAGDARQEWLRHIKECPECARALEQAQGQVEQIRSLIVSAGTRSEGYWTAQHARIQARIESEGDRFVLPIWRFAVAATAIAAMAIALMVGHSGKPPMNGPDGPTKVVKNHAIVKNPTDEQLMAEMEEVADSDVPKAMEPAYVLTQDMEYHATTDPSQLHKNTNTSRQDR